MTLTAVQQKMVADNLGLITFTMTKRCRIERGHPMFDDLWQEGVLGLIRAAELFDPDKARFSTYAVIWIRQAVQRGQEHLEGKNWTHARRHGREYQRPLSLDVAVSDNKTFGDLHLVGDGDCEADALDDTARLVDELCALAADDIDRAVIRAAVDHPDVPGSHRDKQVAGLYGIAPESARRRRRALAARYREQVDA